MKAAVNRELVADCCSFGLQPIACCLLLKPQRSALKRLRLIEDVHLRLLDAEDRCLQIHLRACCADRCGVTLGFGIFQPGLRFEQLAALLQYRQIGFSAGLVLIEPEQCLLQPLLIEQ